AIEAIIQDWCNTRSTGEILDIFSKAGIPAAKVATPEDVVKNPQLLHRKQITTINHPKAGEVAVSGVTMRLTDTPLTIRRPPPMLGEHNADVLADWLGLAEGEVEGLKSDGVL